jgi:hypothetical protein
VTQDPDTFVVRQRFWPLWIGLTLFFQLALALLVGAGVAFHLVFERPRLLLDDFLGIGAGFTALGVLCLGLAWLARHSTRVFLSPDGIRVPTPRVHGRRDRQFPWADLVGADLFVRFPSRWLRVWTADGLVFLVSLRVSDPDGFLAAVERFAEPDHPLAVALRAHLPPDPAA